MLCADLLKMLLEFRQYLSAEREKFGVKLRDDAYGMLYWLIKVKEYAPFKPANIGQQAKGVPTPVPMPTFNELFAEFNRVMQNDKWAMDFYTAEQYQKWLFKRVGITPQIKPGLCNNCWKLSDCDKARGGVVKCNDYETDKAPV